MSYSVVLSTFKDKKEASRIAGILLKAKVAACVSIVGGVESRYWWKGSIEKSREAMAVIKTRKNLVGKVVALIKKNHSYSVPEIIEMPILSGNKDYLDWISKTTR